MKLALLIIASAAVLALLSGCASDGSPDYNTIGRVVNGGLNAYQQGSTYQRPPPYTAPTYPAPTYP